MSIPIRKLELTIDSKSIIELTPRLAKYGYGGGVDTCLFFGNGNVRW